MHERITMMKERSGENTERCNISLIKIPTVAAEYSQNIAERLERIDLNEEGNRKY